MVAMQNKQNVNKNNVQYVFTFTVWNISSERHVTVRQFNVWRNCLTVDRDAVDIR